MGRSDFPEARSLRKNYTETAFLPPVVILNMLLLTVRWFCYWRKHQFLYHKFVVLFTHQSFNQMLLDYDDLMKIPFFKARTADLNGQVEKLRYRVWSLVSLSDLRVLLVWRSQFHGKSLRENCFPVFGLQVGNLFQNNNMYQRLIIILANWRVVWWNFSELQITNNH